MMSTNLKYKKKGYEEQLVKMFLKQLLTLADYCENKKKIALKCLNPCRMKVNSLGTIKVLDLEFDFIDRRHNRNVGFPVLP
tara:strand:+ start:303 stop:545 length:243 start_codon:yes stop_codon:yes gene_type:complete